MRCRRSVFCATFRRLSPPPSRERPALRCPDFPRAPKGPRSPGLHPEFYRRFRGGGAPVQHHLALGAADGRPVVEDELAADGALERGPAQHREQLLLEGSVQGRHAHSSRNTPTTLPRICTCSGKSGSSSSFSGWRRMRPFSRKNVLTVASSADSSSPASAHTISPLRASCAPRTTTMSPSRIPALTIDSPLTRRRKSPRSVSGTAISSSTFCSASSGP